MLVVVVVFNINVVIVVLLLRCYDIMFAIACFSRSARKSRVLFVAPQGESEGMVRSAGSRLMVYGGL